MTAAYDLWRALMYCVGVFVTCNVGGVALRWGCARVSGLMNPHEKTPEGTSVKAANDLNAVIRGFTKGLESMAESMGSVVTVSDTELVRNGGGRGGQSFEDMQRQIQGEREDAPNETE